ncbi:NAD(P)-dependent dehydrogenase (short-subunit alcohol dehydrogenase family) [Trinickia symbiotica]|uniref:Uncharacterized oxidoreductase YghA n=1 Tax=Trinickia symbiotica TaxID=863227 RepID=A0A2N7WQQ2_9BURK|nr:SDR family oxidoreductase [Trinickia symbiotica]PMS31661.1 NAD(P)-dependent oxidoreductase [Trinickia symbiotica]PPK41429.1 NAD(P)-dependent dehydrogenase (short-subunit alcohol dehydrogenase family) [Trinickia symbiotica]
MATDDISTSRRKLMQGATAGLMTAVAARAIAQSNAQQDGQSTGNQAGVPPDPRSLYAHPPFPAQHQPWPGLAGRMTPRPDHGENSYRGSGKLTGRHALITGGDSGIGRAAAIAYAREGADVAIVYLPEEEPDAREVVQLIQAAGRKAVALPGDLRNESFCRKLVGDAQHQLGGLDILVNNAARQQSHDSILDITTEQFDWTLRTNLYAMFWLTQTAIPLLPPGSAIVNTTSVNAYEPGVNILDYAMTKAAIANFTKGLAKQLIDRGIRVNAVAPGPFWTPLQVSGGQTTQNLEHFGERVPMKRPGQPAELAPIYVLLASAQASYVTGQIYGAMGGEGQP